VRTFRRSAVLTVLTATIAALGASSASAAITLREDGTSIVHEDADLSNDTVIGIDVDKLTIQNLDGSGLGIRLYPGGVCDFAAGSGDKAECPAASFGDIQATYGGGNDKFRLYQVCVPSVTVALGNGTNEFTGEACDGTSTAVSGGSGQDRFGSSDGSDTFVGGGGDDDLQGYGGDDEIHGGEGNERVDGGSGNDLLFGDGGTDEIAGRAGDDTEDGGPGDDRMGYSPAYCCTEDVDTGADDVRGGDGTDVLTLEDHPGGMAISLDDQPNDGAPNEGDNIHSDLESISGTGANDVFVGNPGNNNFSGGAGNDEMHGGGGADHLEGGSSDDRIYGDAGNDKLEGDSSSDIVDGGSGTDEIYGDISSCSVFCRSDPDQLFARDGERDIVDCGGGADQAQVDQLDIVAFCLTVDRQTVSTPGGTPAPTGGGGSSAAAFALTVAKSVKLKALLKKGLAFRLKCGAACKVVATLSYKGKKLGAGRKTLGRAGTARVVVRIAKKSRAKVRRLKGKKLTLRVKVTSKGKTTTLSRKVKLKR
jgi:Ca2+-binding RTX toxin-like protein